MKLLLIILLLSTLSLNAKTLEIYFDTPELFLLKNNSSIKYQAVSYISKKKNKTKYHENIIYTYDINKTKTFPVKHYNSVKSLEGKHPLLSLVKRDSRESFTQTLKANGLKYPLKLKYILQTNDATTSYKQLFELQTSDDCFFSLKIQYPYLVNLFYALLMAIIGGIVIFTFFRKRLRSS